MQTIMAFLWTFEPGIKKLLPPERRDEFAVYSVPLRMGALRALKRQNHRDQLQGILGFDSIRKMHRLMHAGAIPSLSELMRDIKYSALTRKALIHFTPKGTLI